MLGAQSKDDIDSPALTPISNYCTNRKQPVHLDSFKELETVVQLIPYDK